MAWREKRHAEKAAVARQAELELIARGRKVMTDALAIIDGPGIDAPLLQKKGEKSLFSLASCGLIEPRSGGGQWQGRSSGFSIPVGGGVRYRVGQTRGHYVKNPEVPTVIDTGTTTITDQRVVFMGTKRTVEWLLAKLVGVSHADGEAWTSLQVSNRQKVQGITYPPGYVVEVHLWLAIAPELLNGRIDEVRKELHEQLTALDNELTAGPLKDDQDDESPGASETLTPFYAADPAQFPPPSASPPPSWQPDPFGKFEYRYWDGTRWTEHVATHGVQSVNPPPSIPDP